jgi:alpha-mannosidase
MPATNVYIINHTHWDREWFLTSIYTSHWIPGLIDKLERLAADNPDFCFLFDGQTLVIEDLLAVAPAYEHKIRDLVGSGCLQIGPYYSQPDWQLTNGELLIRNLIYGQQDVVQFGGKANTGWLVDTFGHISQSPQIHRMFGIDSVFVWRGVPQLEPYFHWQGADGSQLLAINLFGGYRNLYGVTHAPEVAGKRLETEVDKLRPYYPTPELPLFDGYDLEDNPEDPLTFYADRVEIRPDLILHETTPMVFARTIRSKHLPLPTIYGELNSGKYGATFPGTFSARTYLKIMAYDCQLLLFQLCEPLAAMAWLKGRTYNVAQFETWGRMLLQNAVHDCICGVSIDQVHEKMEYSYRQVYEGLIADIPKSLAAVLGDFMPGEYAVSTTPFAIESWQAVAGEWVQLKTEGVGVWPVAKRLPIETINEPVETFSWRNAFYTATVNNDGVVMLDQGSFGELIVSAEQGDTYSDKLGERLGVIRPSTPLTIVEKSTNHCVIAFDGHWQNEHAAPICAWKWCLRPVNRVKSMPGCPLMSWKGKLSMSIYSRANCLRRYRMCC